MTTGRRQDDRGVVARWMPWLGFAAFYTAVTLVYAWPLLGAMGSVLPHDAGDPGLNTWILWWNAQAMPLTERWWNAPMFFPAHGAFALSETLLSVAPLTTPLSWAGTSAVVTYNIAFIVSFPAAALAAHALAHRLTGRHDAALLAGLAYGFSPYRAAQMPHLQTLWSCWMPLCLLALHQYLDTRRWRFLACAGVCWVLNGLTSGYFLMYFAVLIGLWFIWFVRAWRDWIRIGSVLAAASLVLAPVLIGYATHQRAFGLVRNTTEIGHFAADLSAVWATSPHVWLPHHWTFQPWPEGELYPGAVVLLLTMAGSLMAWHRGRQLKWPRPRIVAAVIGGYLAEISILTLWLGSWRTSLFGIRISMTRPVKALFIAVSILAVAFVWDPRTRDAWRRRSTLFFYTTAAVVMLMFALGPVGRVFGDPFWYSAPYGWLMDLPGGRALRVPARFAMLFVLCLTQAAALAFARLMPGGFRVPAAGVLAVAILLEGWVPTLPTAGSAPPVDMPRDPRAAVLELPLRGVLSDTAALLRATDHALPVVNGFSGYSPPHYDLLREGIQTHDTSVLDALRQFGPLLVLVRSALDPEGSHDKFIRQHPDVELVKTTPIGPVYRLPASVAPALRAGSPLPIADVIASVNPDLAGAITDGRIDTRWHSGVQVPGQQVTVTLAAPSRLSRVDLDLAAFTTDYPRRLRVEVGDLAHPPTIVWEGSTAGLAIGGILSDPARASVSIPLTDAGLGQRLVLTLTGGHPSAYWSIAELRVYGPAPVSGNFTTR